MRTQAAQTADTPRRSTTRRASERSRHRTPPLRLPGNDTRRVGLGSPDPHIWIAAASDAIIRAAVAVCVGDGTIQQRDAALVAQSARARLPGSDATRPAPADGTQPMLWELAAAHVLDIAAADYAAAGGRHPRHPDAEPQPAAARSSLLPHDCFAADPDPDRLGGCADTARASLVEAAHREPHPLDVLAAEATTSPSPLDAFDTLGLGRRVGNDLGIAARMHDTRIAAAAALATPSDDNLDRPAQTPAAHASALVVLSRAHIDPPGGIRFRCWASANLTADNGHEPGQHPGQWAVSGILDVAVRIDRERPLAAQTLAAISQLAPEAVEAGIRDFCAFRAGQRGDFHRLAAVLRSEPALRGLPLTALRRHLRQRRLTAPNSSGTSDQATPANDQRPPER